MHSLDTTPDARAIQLAALRAMGPDRRVALALEMSEELRLVTMGGLRNRHPMQDEDELVGSLIALWHGSEVADQVRRETNQS